MEYYCCFFQRIQEHLKFSGLDFCVFSSLCFLGLGFFLTPTLMGAGKAVCELLFEGNAQRQKSQGSQELSLPAEPTQRDTWVLWLDGRMLCIESGLIATQQKKFMGTNFAARVSQV